MIISVFFVLPPACLCATSVSFLVGVIKVSLFCFSNIWAAQSVIYFSVCPPTADLNPVTGSIFLHSSDH